LTTTRCRARREAATVSASALLLPVAALGQTGSRDRRRLCDCSARARSDHLCVSAGPPAEDYQRDAGGRENRPRRVARGPGESALVRPGAYPVRPRPSEGRRSDRWFARSVAKGLVREARSPQRTEAGAVPRRTRANRKEVGGNRASVGWCVVVDGRRFPSLPSACGSAD
jgi:hypothetical protein